MGEGGGGEEKGFFPSPLFLFRFHFSPFPQKRLILRLYIVKMGNVGFFGEFKNFKMATISCYMSLFFWCTGVALATRDSPRVLYCMEGEFEKIITNFE